MRPTYALESFNTLTCGVEFHPEQDPSRQRQLHHILGSKQVLQLLCIQKFNKFSLRFTACRQMACGVQNHLGCVFVFETQGSARSIVKSQPLRFSVSACEPARRRVDARVTE